MEDKNYNYETKCRRCGTLTKWHFSPANRFSYLEFVDAMEDYIQYPRAFECSNCKKKTVQDVVSYSPNGGE
jgi:hypothetical protein